MIKIIVIATAKSMVTLNIENLPDEIMGQIQTLARQQNRTINEQAILMLQEAAEKQQTLVGSGISPENHPSFEERRQALAKIQAEIDGRLKKRRTDVQWPDSTALIREDREMRPTTCVCFPTSLFHLCREFLDKKSLPLDNIWSDRPTEIKKPGFLKNRVSG